MADSSKLDTQRILDSKLVKLKHDELSRTLHNSARSNVSLVFSFCFNIMQQNDTDKLMMLINNKIKGKNLEQISHKELRNEIRTHYKAQCELSYDQIEQQVSDTIKSCIQKMQQHKKPKKNKPSNLLIGPHSQSNIHHNHQNSKHANSKIPKKS